MPRAKISINSQHDFITLKLPTGNFTTSFGGAKASGELASMKGAFEALDKYVQTEGEKRSYGEVMEDLKNPELLDRLVPGWDKPKVINISVGDSVKFCDALFVKKYPDTYKVISVKPKYAFIEVPKKGGGMECIGFAKHSLDIA